MYDESNIAQRRHKAKRKVKLSKEDVRRNRNAGLYYVRGTEVNSEMGFGGCQAEARSWEENKTGGFYYKIKKARLGED